MFARSILRSAAPLRQSTQSFRSYATQSSGGGSSNALLYGLGALGLGGGGYYYYANVRGQAPPIPNVPAPGQEKGQNPQASGPPSSADAKAFLGGDQGFISLKLDKIEEINHNIKKFIFKLPAEDQVSGLPIASALITKFKGEGMDKPVIRPYTPTSDSDKKGFLELIIKKYPNGPMSEHIHSMTPGQSLEIKGPIPKYPVTPNKHDHIAMIAGGTGITPMYQVIRGIFKNPEDKTKVTLVFGNIAAEDILLKKEFDELENTYPRRFKAFYTLDKPPEDWPQGKGFITKDLLKTVLPEPKEENIKIFICGPPGLYKAVSGPKPSPQNQGELTGILSELGYAQDQVFKF